ncbi:SRPBCC family protein [uncultured Roseobacter sp.]|uniref:SRPBCC family protein n=1 Tax=uncultured Roseobacter sp. TaxID=114847 RepID=UPI002601A066|nr:SRPBCC family protein [uncultured Roseobacter sp.]
MKFSTQEVMEAPIDAVFAMLTRFEHFERAAMRRGADVQRIDDLTTVGVGMKWLARFQVRGRTRELKLEVEVYEPPHHMVLDLTSPGLHGDTRFELIALSTRRTRIMVSLEMRPFTLSARLLLQPLRLTKSSLTRKYKERIASYIGQMEEQYRNSA